MAGGAERGAAGADRGRRFGVRGVRLGTADLPEQAARRRGWGRHGDGGGAVHDQVLERDGDHPPA